MMMVLMSASFLAVAFLLSSPPVALSAPQAGHELSSSHQRLGPRYQVLKEFVLSGQKNVRYETKPIQYMDGQGNSMNSASFRSGSKSGCIDMEGRQQAEGAEYERSNGHFKYRCNNGQEEVAACIGSDRTNKARIDVGQSLEINGYWHKCEKYPNGSVIYTQASSCSSGSKNYRVGDEILLGNLRMVCGEQGYSVSGCYFYQDGQVQKLGPGEQREVGGVTHFCEDKGNTLQYYTKGSTGCQKAGKEFAEGEVYSANHLRYKCQNGAMEVTGCYLDEGHELGIGQDAVDKNMVHRCYRLGAKVEYTEYACGYNGTPSCSPEPIPQTPDQVPALGHGLSSPGFGSFSVVETDGTQVKQPSSVSLELQKVPVMAQPMAI